MEGRRFVRRATETARESWPLQREELYQRAQRYKEEGKPVAWVWGNSVHQHFQAILWAFDIAPLFVDQYAAASAAKGVITPFLDICDADGISNSMCGYARYIYGYARKLSEDGVIPPGMPGRGWPQPDLLVGRSSYCEGPYKSFQSLKKYLDVPYYNVDARWPAPHTGDLVAYRKRFIQNQIDDLKGFVAFLERFTGKKLDKDKLSDIVARFQRVHWLISAIWNMRKTRPCPLPCEDCMDIIGAFFWCAELPSGEEYFLKLYQEIKNRVDNKMGVVPEEKYRLMWVELPPWHSMDVYNILEDRGAVVVIESLSYTQSAYCHGALDNIGVTDPLEILAKQLADWVLVEVERAEKEAMCWRVQNYLDMAREWKVDGAILHVASTCLVGRYNLNHANHMLMKYLKVPSLPIIGDMVDVRVFPPIDEYVRMVESFLEVVDHYKGVRKRAGMLD